MYPVKVLIKHSHLNARLVGLDEYLCEDAVVVDLHGHDGLVRLDLAQHVARPDLVALLQKQFVQCVRSVFICDTTFLRFLFSSSCVLTIQTTAALLQ